MKALVPLTGPPAPIGEDAGALLHVGVATPVAHDVGVVLTPGAVDAAVPAGPARTRAEVRRLFLEQSAVSIGQRWADQWRSDLHREGRPAAGGWPGTLREARVRVERHFLAEATRRKISAVTQAEREVAARRAYASARARWCRQAEPEAP